MWPPWCGLVHQCHPTCLSHILSSTNRTDFTFPCHATLCLCALAYGVPLVCNIFLPLIDFCQHISNHNFHWKNASSIYKAQLLCQLPKEPFWIPLPEPRGPLCFYNAWSFLCHHTDCLSFITWVPDREVQQKSVELSLYYLLSLGQVTWPSHISVFILIQGLWNYLIECCKIAIRLCKIKLLGKRQVSELTQMELPVIKLSLELQKRPT